MTETIAEIKATLLPTLFQHPQSIVEYGRSHVSKESMSELGDLMEVSPVSQLAGTIADIVAKLVDADPQRIAKRPTWLARMTGQSVETFVRYQVAKKTLDALLDETQVFADRVRGSIDASDTLKAVMCREIESLQCHLQTGREYLEEHPNAGLPDATDSLFDNARERFSRRLTSMAALLHSHELSIRQVDMTKKQAIDMLDRFEETTSVLVPIWRQQSLVLATTKHLNSTMVLEASKAHKALLQSLSQNLLEMNR